MPRRPASSPQSTCSAETRHEPHNLETYFSDVAALLDRSLAAGEIYTCGLDAETSDFVRLNRGKVRQPGTVTPMLSAAAPHPRPTPRRAVPDRCPATSPRTVARHCRALARAAANDDCDPVGGSAPEFRHRGESEPGRRHCRPAHGGGNRRDGACRRRRPGPGGHLRRRSGLPRLRQLARPAQLARGALVQPAVEPLPPRRQGGEDGLRRFQLGAGALRRQDDGGTGAPRPAGTSVALAQARALPRLPHPDGHGGNRRHALLGWLLRPGARDPAELPVPLEGRRRRARSVGGLRRKHRRRRCAGIPGRRLYPAGRGAPGSRRADGRLAGQSPHRARIRTGAKRRERRRGAGIARHGAPAISPPPTPCRPSIAVFTSATSGISTSPTGPRAG